LVLRILVSWGKTNDLLYVFAVVVAIVAGRQQEEDDRSATAWSATTAMEVETSVEVAVEMVGVVSQPEDHGSCDPNP
jgi:hypothetical protein